MYIYVCATHAHITAQDYSLNVYIFRIFIIFISIFNKYNFFTRHYTFMYKDVYFYIYILTHIYIYCTAHVFAKIFQPTKLPAHASTLEFPIRLSMPAKTACC